MRGCNTGNASASLKAAITMVRQQSSGAMRCMCRWYASVAAGAQSSVRRYEVPPIARICRSIARVRRCT